MDKNLRKLHDLKHFLEHVEGPFCDDKDLLKLYGQTIDISLNRHKVSIPFDAEMCHELLKLINTAIKEY